MFRYGWLFLASCAGEAKNVPSPETSEAAPAIGLATPSVDFGTVSVADDGEPIVTVEITNNGGGQLVLGDISSDSDDVIVGQLYPPVLAPGDVATLDLHYAPVEDTSTDATVTIASNDPAAPEARLAVTGEALAPRLSVPDTVDIGTVAVGCGAEEAVLLENTGREDLVIDAADLSALSNMALLSDDPALSPWVIAPGDATELLFSYGPADTLGDTAIVMLSTNAPGQETAPVTLTGLGDTSALVSESFTTAAPDAADILFAIDKSCGMADDIATFAADFSSFTSALDANGTDYRIAALVQDSGSVAGMEPHISPDNVDDADDILSDMLGGSVGSLAEMGFSLLYNAVATGSGRPGEWLRDDAALHLIGFSDEPEQSTTLSWDGYVSYFQGLKDHTNVRFHAIGGDYPSGCGSATAYVGFYEAVVATDGGFHSICAADLSKALEDIAGRIDRLGSGSLDLGSEPVLDTVSVTVDGKPWTDWSYADQLILHNIDEAGAEVIVTYLPRGACE